MKTLTFAAPPQDILIYDPDTDPPSQVNGGETFEVSDDRALELLTNPHIAIEEVATELSKLKRDELNKIASDAGIESPESYPSKPALIEAIENPPLPAVVPDNPDAQGETT